ncbi:MAG: hypothetical protein K2J77_02735 [Oscillospiraceae bacterium]|nr:hypothetical protein [Oscillospiraceae bacterium]
MNSKLKALAIILGASMLGGCAGNAIGESSQINLSKPVVSAPTVISNTISATADSKPDSGAPCESAVGDVITTIKCRNYTIENDGSLLDDMGMGRRYFTAMDNNYFYYSSASYPETIFSVDRSDQKVNREIMTYDLNVEWGFTTSKRTYCGHYVVFPCYGTPNDEYLTLRAIVGKSGEKAKCILEQPTGSFFICAAELSENEMAFLCTAEQRGTFNIYKYNFNEEQAQLIYTKKLDTQSANSNPLIACCDGDIYFVFRTSQNENVYCIRRIDADGNECENIFLELPGYSDVSMAEFTVTANNIFIRFQPPEENGYFQTVLYNKSTAKISLVIGDNGLGVRFNDGLIDDRYILFRAGSRSDQTHPMVCLFDDWTSEFHFITFAAIENSKILNTVADKNGDVVFYTHEDGDISSIMFNDMCSLIERE